MIYDTENIFSCKLPDFASLSPGANLIGLTPIRSWSGLSQFSERHLDYASSGVVYDPFSAERLDLYYLYTGSCSVVITVTISTNTSNGELHVLKQNCTTIRRHARDLRLPFVCKGLSESHSARTAGSIIGLVSGKPGSAEPRKILSDVFD